MGNSLQSILVLVFLSLSFFSWSSYAKINRKPFNISISGNSKAMKGLQKRAELKMARSTAYCRGFYMPKAISTWSCKKNAPRTTTCKLQYKCKVTTTKFNRSSEVRRLKKDLSKLRVSKERLKIKVSRKPYRRKIYKTKKLVKKLSAVKAASAVKPKPIPKIAPPKPVASKSIIDNELDELSKFNESDTVDEALVKSDLDQDLSEGLDDDLDEDLDELNEEVEKKTEKLDESTTDSSSDDEEESESNDDESPYTSNPAKLATFSFDLIQVADDFDSLVTMGLSWTPRKDFNSKIGMRGQFGLKSLKIFSGTSLEETFIVYELGLYLNLNFNANLYAEVGYLLQKWNNTAADSHSSFSFGVGYKFTDKVMKIFDRVFIDYSTVSNESSNRELKFSTGFSF